MLHAKYTCVVANNHGIARDLSRDLRECHSIGGAGFFEDVVVGGHDAGSNIRRTLVPFGTAEPAAGICFTSLPLPSITGTSPAAPTARTASRAPMPWVSG